MAIFNLHAQLRHFSLSTVLVLASAIAHSSETVENAPIAETPVQPVEQAPTQEQTQNSETPTESLPEAENIDLSEPVPPEELVAPVSPEPEDTSPPQATIEKETKAQRSEEAALVILNKKIAKGTTTRLSWSPDQSFKGIETPTPVLVAHGNKPGPALCLTAAVHGDELIGIEVVRRIMYDIDPTELTGTVIGVPIVNLQGFRRSSRYLTDRRDLNRFFPGNPEGSSASRIAYSFFEQVIRHCDFLVDLHTGSFYRTNLPQLRANLRDERVMQLTKSFDAIAVLHSEGAIGTLRRAAVDAGIPAVTLEAGGPMELDEDYVDQGTKAVNTLLDRLGMLDTISFWGTPQPAYYGSVWVRADQGGILFSQVKLGAKVRKGDLLGSVTDPITNIRSLILAPQNGRVIGMALNQVVLPGFAAFHIGIAPGSAENPTPFPSNDEGLRPDGDGEEEEGSFDEFD